MIIKDTKSRVNNISHGFAVGKQRFSTEKLADSLVISPQKFKRSGFLEKIGFDIRESLRAFRRN